ncbi:MAG: YciI family protein [Gammaproteobacteria bacterium]|nr:YciI family protein [Gammaproteobacteria bacterium]
MPTPSDSEGAAVAHYLLIYELAPDYLERRRDFRDRHLALAWAAHERGELVLAGALADPADQAVLFFQGASPAGAEAFAKADPYVCNGVVRSWRVRPWTTVVGREAATPVPAPPGTS